MDISSSPLFLLGAAGTVAVGSVYGYEFLNKKNMGAGILGANLSMLALIAGTYEAIQKNDPVWRAMSAGAAIGAAPNALMTIGLMFK